MKILFLEPFTPYWKSSLSAQAKTRWGETSGEALKIYLTKIGHQITSISQLVTQPQKGTLAERETAYILKSYQKLLQLQLEEYDLIFIFHILQHFPADIKRILFSQGKREIPIVGYTHGSHWDPSDVWRTIHYPSFKIQDLANLHTLDRILVVSNHMRGILFENLFELNPKLAKRINAKMRVVGLPINIDLLEKFRTKRKFRRLTIIFNHSFISSKHPIMFLRIMQEILKRYDINLIITREVSPDDEATKFVLKLKEHFPGRIFLGGDLPVSRYYRVLWMSDIQVSTATHESLGIATLEAMYTKNCCVLPNQCVYPEIVGNVKEALYPYSEGGLYKKLSFFIEHKNERQRIGEILHNQSLKYNPQKVGTKVSKVLEEIVEIKKSHIH